MAKRRARKPAAKRPRASPETADAPAPDPRLASTDPAEIVAAYQAGVLDGSIPACLFVRQAVERQQRDLANGAKRGLAFDEAAARRVIQFFGFLKHSKGEWYGKPFVLSPWQVFLLWVLFGWKWSATGLRRFRVAYVELPRKNGKSTLVAGIGLYLLVADGEGGAEIYTAATKKEQARIVHSEAMRMVRASPELSSLVQRYHSSLSVESTNSRYEPIGANSETQDGLNPHCVLVERAARPSQRRPVGRARHGHGRPPPAADAGHHHRRPRRPRRVLGTARAGR